MPIAKVSDFGMTRVNESGLTNESAKMAGTVKYMAPEVLGQGGAAGRITKAADVFSFGMSVFPRSSDFLYVSAGACVCQMLTTFHVPYLLPCLQCSSLCSSGSRLLSRRT